MLSMVLLPPAIGAKCNLKILLLLYICGQLNMSSKEEQLAATAKVSVASGHTGIRVE